MACESKWTEIPPEILIKIAKLCTTTAKSTFTFSCKLQLRRLAAVCKPWRSTISRMSHQLTDSPPLSHDIPIPIPAFREISVNLPRAMEAITGNYNGLLYLIPSTACLVQSIKDPSDSHLLIVDHLGCEGKVYCRKPLLTIHDKSCNWDKNCPKLINLLDYHFSVVAEEYSLRVLIKDDNGVLRFLDSCYEFCKKSVMIRNPNSKAGLGGDGVVFVLFDGGKLAMYVFSEKRWEFIYECATARAEKCSDVQRYEEGCVLIIDHKANAFRVNYDFTERKLCWTKIADEIRGCRDRRKRLVVDPEHGGLLLVVQATSVHNFVELKMVYNVYLFRKLQQKWLRLQYVPGITLFVGNDFAFTMGDEAFPGVCSGNCVFAGNGSFPLYKDVPDHEMEAFFKEIDNGLCAFKFGDYCAARVYLMGWGGYDFGSIFESPNEWLDWNHQTPSSAPQHPLEQKHDVQIEPKSDNRSGVCSTGSVKPMLDLNVHLDHSSLGAKEVPEEKGKRIADDPDHVDSANNSRLPKSRRITLSKSSAEVGNPNSEQDFDKIKSLLKSVSELVNSPAVTLADQPGCTSTEVIQVLASLPEAELGNDFSACLFIGDKENQELYVCHDGADVKDKWLHYMFDRSKM